VGCHDLLNDRKPEPRAAFAAVAGLERLDQFILDVRVIEVIGPMPA
jgi:hypothetical protein